MKLVLIQHRLDTIEQLFKTKVNIEMYLVNTVVCTTDRTLVHNVFVSVMLCDKGSLIPPPPLTGGDQASEGEKE